MSTTDDIATLTLPRALLVQLQTEAEREHRAATDVLQDAMKRYVREKRWQETLAYGRQRARALGLTEDDIPRLIAEARAEAPHEHGR